MRAVLVGTVESSRIVLESIARAPGWTLALAITLPLEKRASHSDFVDLAAAADAAGCPLLRVDKINSEEAIAAVRAANADYVFVVGWSQICGPEFRAACRDHVIGYHPAPLPRLRGRAVIPWTILNEEPITAGTLFWIDEGVDSGPILLQQFFHVSRDETAASLYRKHMEVLRGITSRALDALSSPAPPREVQDECVATWAARRKASDGVIDWTRPAAEVERLIRALSGPYPPAFTFEGPHRIEITRAHIRDDGRRFLASAGQVVSRSTGEFSVKCGDGMRLVVAEWSHPEQRAPRLHSRLRMDALPAVHHAQLQLQLACNRARGAAHV